jgi:hypothetical protein
VANSHPLQMRKSLNLERKNDEKELKKFCDLSMPNPRLRELIPTSKICLNQYLAIGSGNPVGDDDKSRMRVDVQELPKRRSENLGRTASLLNKSK